MAIQKQLRTIKPTPLRGNLKEEDIRRAVQTVKARRLAEQEKSRAESARRK